MHRPKKEDYIIQYNFSYGSWRELDDTTYQEALNSYIDDLEKQNSEITKAYYDVINTFGKELYKREKAFNNCYDVLVGHKVYVASRKMNKKTFRKWCEEYE